MTSEGPAQPVPPSAAAGGGGGTRGRSMTRDVGAQSVRARANAAGGRAGCRPLIAGALVQKGYVLAPEKGDLLIMFGSGVRDVSTHTVSSVGESPRSTSGLRRCRLRLRGGDRDPLLHRRGLGGACRLARPVDLRQHRGDVLEVEVPIEAARVPCAPDDVRQRQDSDEVTAEVDDRQPANPMSLHDRVGRCDGRVGSHGVDGSGSRHGPACRRPRTFEGRGS